MASRIVIGGGIFGSYAALVLARRGIAVDLVEQDTSLLTRASLVNQARLHTGLHYPRSLITAQEAFDGLARFRHEFPQAIREFPHVYAIAAWNSKTSAATLESHMDRLGVSSTPVSHGEWFRDGMIEQAFMVDEPAFDAHVLRAELTSRIKDQSGIRVHLGRPVVELTSDGASARATLSDGVVLQAQGIVLASYASTNALLELLGAEPMPLRFELTEVLLGTPAPALAGMGFTIMDGPFWSMMPFGHSALSTLTSVGMTPLESSVARPSFSCQERRADCSPAHLRDCQGCAVAPPSGAVHHVQLAARYLREAEPIAVHGRMLTVKTLLATTEVDDARPTLVRAEAPGNVWTIMSGKVNTVFDLDGALP